MSPIVRPTSQRAAPSVRPSSLPLLAFSGIELAAERVTVLRRLDLMLHPGRALGITGPNGSGKTTLLQLAATLRRPVAGTGRVLGADLRATIPAEVRQAICLVGHEPALYPQLTLAENLRFVAALFGRPERTAEQSLATVGLARAADRRVEQCSQGMARRADLARALISEPRLLLLDEAHAGLDDAAADLVGFLLARVRDAGGGALLVSHDRERLAPLVEEMLELRNGRLAGETGRP